MKAFLPGALGALAMMAIVALVVPMYSDYRTVAQSTSWIADLRSSTMPQVTDAAKRRGTIVGSGIGIAAPTFTGTPPEHVEITDDGSLILHGGRDGQFMVLTPRIENGDVRWACRGGSARGVPSRCRIDAER